MATRQKPVTTDNEDAAETNGAAGKSRAKAPAAKAAAKNAVKPAAKTAARPRLRAKAAVAEQAPPAEETAAGTNGAAPLNGAGNGVETADVTTPYASALAVAAIAADPTTDEPNPDDIKATEEEAKEAVSDAQQDDMEGDVIDDPVRMYLREIGRVTLLTAADERRLALQRASYKHVEKAVNDLRAETGRTPRDTDVAKLLPPRPAGTAR